MSQLRCSKCKEVKLLTEFSARQDATRGYEYHCKECRKLAGRLARARSQGNVIAAQKWKSKNRAHTRKQAREWQIANPGKTSANRRAYEVRKVQAIPPWSNLAEVAKKYVVASYWNEIWPEDPVHVDHIIPLKGKNVSGLHTELNLQILRAIDNIRKSNKLISL